MPGLRRFSVRWFHCAPGHKILDQTAGLTLGVGFRVKGIRIDYAFSAYDLSLGATHRFSVGFGY